MKMTVSRPYNEYQFKVELEREWIARYTKKIALEKEELEELKGRWFVGARRKKCLKLIEMFESHIEESKKNIEKFEPLAEEEEKRLEEQRKAYEDNLRMVKFCKKYHEEHPHKARRCRKKF